MSNVKGLAVQKTRSLIVSVLVTAFLGCGSSVAQEMDVRDFVRQIFIHGVPYEEASKYGPAAAPVLLDLLADPGEEAAWPNIVVTLGIIGDPRAIDPLMDFLKETVPQPTSPNLYSAKTSVLFALGYIVHKSRNERALQYLLDSVDPGVWRKRGIRWASPFAKTTQAQDRDLSTAAILALGLTGVPEARQILQALRQPGRTAQEKAFRVQVSGVVEDSLAAHEIISRRGMVEYYRQATKGFE